MKKDDSDLIWEAYDGSNESSWSQEGYEELDYEKIPTSELSQLTPDEAKVALDKMSELWDLYQRHERAFTDPRQSKLLQNVKTRMKILRDVINPPKQYTPEEYEELLRQQRERRDKEYREVMRKRHPNDPQFQ